MTLATHTQAADQLQAARQRADSGQTQQAMAECASLIRAQPGCIAARLLGATLDLSMGRAKEALEDLDVAAWYLQQCDAKHTCDQAIEQLILRGKALMQLQRPEDACGVWRQVVRLSPRHSVALRLMAGALEQMQRYDQAIACLEHVLLMERNKDGATLKMLADLCECDGQFERALAVLERFDLAGEPTLQLRMVRLLRQVGRKSEALERLTRLCRQWPDDLSLALQAAELAGEVGHEAIVIRHAHQSMADRSTRRGAMAAIAAHHQRCGRLAQAGRWWWRLSRPTSTDFAESTKADVPRALAGLAICATVLGRDRLAARAAQMLCHATDDAQRKSLLSEAWLAVTPGRLLLQQQSAFFGSGAGLLAGSLPRAGAVLAMLLNEATATLEQKAEQKPGYADIHHHLAVCHWKLGRRDRAAISSDKALRINGGYAEAAILRARLLIEEGAFEAALAVLNAAVACKSDHVELNAMAGAVEVMTDRRQQAMARLAEQENRQLLRQRIGYWLERLGREGEARQWRSAA